MPKTQNLLPLALVAALGLAAAEAVAERVAASAAPVSTALPHLAGCGQLGPDMRVTHDTLAAYCAHPNVGAVLVMGSPANNT